LNIVKWDRRATVLFVATLVVSAVLVAVAALHGVRAIETATVERVRSERQTAAKQAAGRLSAVLDKVRWRLADPLGRQAAGIEQTTSPSELRDALGRLATNLPIDDVAVFVQERTGRVVALDPRHTRETAKSISKHRHAIPENTSARSRVHICPVCAQEEHSISLVEPIARDRWLVANVRIDQVGAAILDGMSHSGKHGFCIEGEDGVQIVC
jgi:hypothetical protein